MSRLGLEARATCACLGGCWEGVCGVCAVCGAGVGVGGGDVGGARGQHKRISDVSGTAGAGLCARSREADRDEHNIILEEVA
jgi:hypothetical protein